MSNIENINMLKKIKILENYIKQEFIIRKNSINESFNLIKSVENNKLSDIFTYNKIKSMLDVLINDVSDSDIIDNNFYYKYCNVLLNDNYVSETKYFVDTYNLEKKDVLSLSYINLMFYYNNLCQLDNKVIGDKMFNVKDILSNIDKHNGIKSVCVFNKNDKIVLNFILSF